MPLALTFEELVRYSNAERDKWRGWLLLHPEAMDLPVQPGNRHGTVGKLIDHMFLVERRHLQRLMDVPVATVTGLTGNNAPPLFDYGASVRRELEQYVSDLDDEAADQVRVFAIRDEQWHDIAAQAAVPHPAARDPALGPNRARGQAQRPRAAGRARSRLQQSVTLTAESARTSASVSQMPAAATFSSRWRTREVPGMGSMTGERRSSQASAICEGAAL